MKDIWETISLVAIDRTRKKEVSETNSKQQYALPASGKILEEFGEDGQKITIETGKGAAVEAMDGGLSYVLLVRKKALVIRS